MSRAAPTPDNGPAGKAPAGKGVWGWLGRQIGHVSKAVKTEIPDPPTTVYRDARVEEQPHPTDPNVVLRRTVIDEAVVRKGDETKR